MILTEEIFEKGKSSNNGWNIKQLRVFGIQTWKKGWKRSLIGKDFPEESINMFLALKDTHFKNPEAIKNRNDLSFIDAPNLPWKDQYKHPNWQRMRLIVLKRDGFRCINCKTSNKTLHAHHLKYNRNGAIWEVPHWYIVTLCEDCHSQEHGRELTIKNAPLF